MPLSENLIRLRVTDGKSIADVADGAKVPAAVIAAIESGRPSIAPKALKALADYFGVSVETLLR